MKKRLFLFISLLLCLLLPSCGHKDHITDHISGEVVDATPTALILETSEGKRVAVLLEENTHICGMDDIDGDSYKAAPHTGIYVGFYHYGQTDSITTADGTQVNVYHADLIQIDAYLVPEVAILSDGTVLDVWKTSSFSAIYQTQDGVKLLREEAPSGPENHYVGNLESFDDLNETAKSQVSKFYKNKASCTTCR